VKKIQRVSAAGIAAVAALSLAACGSSSSGQSASGGSTPANGASSPSASMPMSSGGASDASGKTTKNDVFGPACSKVPTTGKGSLDGMVSDPVGTAASNNPLLKTLTAAVTKAGLVPTLNKADAHYTVFAPADAAFSAVPKATMSKLLAPAGKAQLTSILTEHVLPMQMNKDGLLSKKTVSTVNAKGGDLKIGGSGDNITVTDPSGNTAKVLCGNIPTANATVFVIDKVLMPKAG
jgi:uncharacterized surface protein with fasciclin (FAS1) repeats